VKQIKITIEILCIVRLDLSRSYETPVNY